MYNPFIPLIQSYLPEPEASLLSGMLFGKTPGFSQDFYQVLLMTGTIHVVALSGMNITILINLISKITFPLGRKLSSILSILAIFAFILFVGPSPTIIRAGIMGSITMISVYFGRQPFSLLSLIFAGFLMVLIKPEIIGSVSFQLSFLSTLGILVFAPTASSDKEKQATLIKEFFWEVKRIFWENLRTTLSAQVATLPVIVFVFKRVSLISPLANVLVGWTVFPITVLGLVTCVVGIVFYPLSWIFSWFAYVLLHYFVRVVEITAGLPFASINLN